MRTYELLAYVGTVLGCATVILHAQRADALYSSLVQPKAVLSIERAEFQSAVSFNNSSGGVESMPAGGLEPTTIVARIAGVPVAYGEIRLYLAEAAGRTFTDFVQRYGVNDQPGFWSMSVSGEVPDEVAKRLALELLKPLKVEQSLCVERGLMPPWDYATFLADLNEENRRRREILDRDGVLHGPRKYRVETYYRYIHSKRQVRLRQIIDNEAEVPSESQLRELYKKHLLETGRFARPDSVSTREFTWWVSDSEGETWLDREKQVQFAHTRLRSEGAMEVYTGLPGNPRDERCTYTWQHPDHRRREMDGLSALDHVLRMEVGAVSNPVRFPGGYRIYVVLQRSPSPPESLAEARAGLLHDLSTKRYEAIIAEVAAASKIELTPAFEAIRVRYD